MFWCVLTFLYNVPFSRAARGTPASQRISTHGYGDLGSQRNGRVGILFCFVSTFLYHEFFSRAAGGKLACRRLSTCGCGNFDSYTSGTGGWGFCFGVAKQFYTMYISPGLRGGNRLAGSSLRTIAAIFFRIEEEREGGYFVLLCFNIFIPCTSLPGCAMELASRRLSNYGRGDLSLHTSGTRGWGFGFGVVQHFYTMYINPRVCVWGTGLQAALYSSFLRFWFTYKRNGGVGVMFRCVSTILYHVHFSRAARGKPAC